MTTYYIDPAGRDSNNGTATGTPWKTLGFALAQSSADDTIIFQGSSKTDPSSDLYLNSTGANPHEQIMDSVRTLQGLGHYWQGMDVTHGSERPELIPNPNMDAWTDTSNMFRLGNGIDNSRSTDVDTRVSGRFVYSIAAAHANAGVRATNVYLVAGRTYEVNGIAKSTALNAQFYTRIRNLGNSNYYNFAAGTWGSSIFNTWPTANENVFRDFSDFYTNTLVPETNSSHSVECRMLDQGGFDTGLVQYLSVKDTEANNWTHEGSDVWMLPGIVMTPYRVLVTTTADWTANGMEGFESVDTGYKTETVEATMASNEGTLWFDTTNRELKLHIPSGSTIADFHIEVIGQTYAMTFEDDSIINDITVGGGLGIEVATGVTTGITATNTHVINNGDFCFHVAGAGTDNQFHSCSAKRSRGTKDPSGSAPLGDGFSVLGGKMTCWGCTTEDTNDEGFEVSNTGEIICYGCRASGAGWETLTRDASSGFKKTGGRDATFIYCSSKDNDIYAFRNDDVNGGTFTLTGCVGNSISLGPSGSNQGTVVIDVDECVATSRWNPLDTTPWEDGTNNQIVAELKVDDDLTPQSDFTEVVGTGTKWWGTDPRPPSASSEPYPDTDVDKGGVQSTWSADHPANL